MSSLRPDVTQVDLENPAVRRAWASAGPEVARLAEQEQPVLQEHQESASQHLVHREG